MAAKKYLKGNQKSYSDLPTGTYKLGYKKDTDAWVEIPELEVDVPTGRKVTLNIRLEGTEEDA